MQWFHKEQGDTRDAASTNFPFLLYLVGRIFKQKYSHHQTQVPPLHMQGNKINWAELWGNGNWKPYTCTPGSGWALLAFIAIKKSGSSCRLSFFKCISYSQTDSLVSSGDPVSTNWRARAEPAEVSTPSPTVPSSQTATLRQRPWPLLPMSCPHTNRAATLDAQSDAPEE